MKRNISTPEAVCRSRQQHYPLVRFLALIVAVCSVFSLIPPVSVMAESEPAANCPLVIHQHDETCYSSENEIICGTADYVVHTHGANCYAPDASLVCELAEIEAHAHGDACFSADQTLICEKEVIVLHTHSDGCRDAEDHLICGLLEVVEHTHSEGCFAATAADTTPTETTIATTAATEATGAAETTEATEAAKVTEATEAAVTKFNAVAPVSGQIIASGTCGDSASWTLTDDGALTISGEGSIKNYLYYNAPWLENSSLITSLTIGEGITSIGTYAFYNCTNLTSVSLPDSLTSINNSAFSGCTSLTSISLPDNLASIGEYVFSNCTSLACISLPDSLTSFGNSAFSNCTSLTSISLPGNITSISQHAFFKCKNLTTVLIPGSVTSIESNAFEECSSLTSIDIPESVTSIGESAFSNCSILTSIDIPDGITSIASSTFYNCQKLTAITIPDSVTSFGHSAFRNCRSLSSVNIPDNVTFIGNYTFYACTNLTSMNIPDGVTSIGSFTFCNCTALTSIHIPNSVTSIGFSAFNGCKNLTSINIPDGVTSIDIFTFSDCTALTSIRIPDTITFIGKSAFKNCNSLTNITIPDSVTSIGESAFYNCSSLSSINIPNGVSSINNSTFWGCENLSTITLPDSIASIGESAFYYCTDLISITIPSGITSIVDYTFYHCTSLASIVIPGTVTSIGFAAFSECNSLASVTIPDSVTSIAPAAFSECSSLTSIAIPDSVASIGASAFSECSSLTSVVIPSNITSIEASTFSKCSSLTSVVIPGNITSIEASAFSNCSALTDITIENGSLSLSTDVFSKCTKLKSVTIAQNADTLLFDVLAALDLDAAGVLELSFVGPNHLHYSGEDFTPEKFGFTEGDYYVDENGVLYRLNSDGTAVLVYCHNDLQAEEYAIASAIPSEDGNMTYTVTAIADNALKNCSNLKEVIIPDTIATIGNYAFQNCTSLTQVTIPGSVTAIGHYAFQNCSNLTQASLSDGICTIGHYAFQNCNGLTQLTIPKSVTFIGNFAFYNCTKLAGVNEESSLPVILETWAHTGANSTTFQNTALSGEGCTITTNKIALTEYTGIPEQPGRLIQISTERFQALTGEKVNTTLYIERGENDSTSVVRVYFQFANEYGSLNYSSGDVMFDDIDAKVYNADVPNTYFIEIQPLKAGQTLSLDLITTYQKIESGGGSALIWMSVMSVDDAEDLKNTVTIPETAHEVIWQTQPNTFELTKKTANSAAILIGDGVEQGGPSVRGLSYIIEMNRAGDALDYGQDYCVSVDFVDTLSLPEHFHWRDGLAQAIANGDWYVERNNKGECCAYVKVGETDYLLASILLRSTYFNNAGLNVDENGNIQFLWTYRNPKIGEECPAVYFQLTFGEDVILADIEALAAKVALADSPIITSFDNTVAVTQHFSYSADQHLQASATKLLSVGAANCTIDKYGYDCKMGEYSPFNIILNNKSPLHYTMLDYVTDEVPDYFYISAGDLEAMFYEDTYGKFLSVTIDHADICGPTPVRHEVVDSEGNAYILTQQFEGINTPHDGKYSQGIDESINEENKAFVIGWSQDKTHLVLEKGSIVDDIFVSEATYPIGPGCQYTSIQQALDDIGFIITKNTAYTCRWDQVGQTLYSGETRVFEVRSTAKDSFMRLIGDQDWHIVNTNMYQLGVWNDAASYFTDGTHKSCVDSVNIYRDFTLFKNAYFNGEKATEASPLHAGDILTYQTVVGHSGSAAYEALPLIDRMTGAQVLLVSCADNTHLAGRNLDTINVNGQGYYILDKEGIYEDVQVGTHWADQVKIGFNATGADTLIYWYLTDVVGETNVTVAYQALISPERACLTAEDASYRLFNEVWLNDHQAHRLYDTALCHGTVLKTSKYIVTNLPTEGSSDLSAHDPSGDELAKVSTIAPTQTITYRLMLDMMNSDSLTIHGPEIFDTLPASVNSYWNKENIAIAYVPAEGSSIEIQNGNSWRVETDAQDPNKQYIRWNEDFSATFSGTLYIYVTMTYPSGKQWGDLVDAFGNTGLYNSFQVHHLSSSVSHILSVQAEVVLEKEVQHTVLHQNDNYYFNNYQNSLWFYSNDAQGKGMVTYSITLYNSGDTRVYLSPIQDVLPEGFTFWTLCESLTTSHGSHAYYNDDNHYYHDSAVSIIDSESDVIFKQAYISASTRKNNNGRQVITFTLSSKGYDTWIHYDEDLGKYYLNPGEAVVIAYHCNTNAYSQTPDAATNLVSMPFYDYNGAGAHIDTETVIDRADPGTITSNNGNRFLATNDQAKRWGINTSSTDNSVQWLSSEVTLYRDTIQPGITKTAEAPYAHVLDPITWRVRASNSGMDNMRGYTMTDVMMAPYQFTGTASYTLGYDQHSPYAYAENLFTFGPRSPGDNQVTITSSAKNIAVLTIDGIPQEIKTYIKIGSKSYPCTISVGLSRDIYDNEILSVSFPSDAEKLYIPAHGYGLLTLKTQNFTTNYKNAIFYNTAYLTPNTAFDTDSVSQGNYIIYNGADSVVSEDNVAVSYGYSTSSLKSATEISNPSNSTKSTSNVNYIALSDSASPFRYTLTVENTGGTSLSKAMDQFILIDNLPQPDDHVTFYPEVQRFSDFRVNFQENPDFAVKVNGVKLDENAYTLQFTTATEFNDADLNGTSTSGWFTLEQIKKDASLSLKDMRSFRILILDAEGTVIPAHAVITVEFNAEADSSQGSIAPAATAWNSFGYSYSLIEDEVMLGASPQKVGVRIASVPALVKQLQYAEGGLCPAKEDATFRFVIYKGPAVALPDNFTEADVFSALADLPFTVAELTVRAGETTSEPRSLDGMYCYRYENGSLEQTDTGWVWEKGNEYTLLELPLTDRTYQFGSFNKTNSNNYTFTYNTAIPQTFTCVNVQSLWNILVEKQCQSAGTPLPGAFFGLYSPSGDDLISDEKFTELSAQLKTAPQRMLTIDSSTWYLMDIQATADNGQIQWRNLGEDAYYLLELQSPKGYILSSQPGQTVRKVTGGTAFVTVTNLPAQDLPYVGGPGTAVLYGAGVGLTGVSLLLGWQKKRKSRKNSNT